jgi:hypothetical protein
MTISPDMRQNAREAKAYDRGSTSAVAVSALAGVVAFIAWAYYIFLAGEGAQPGNATTSTVTLVFALVSTAFCAVFAGVWLLLDTLHAAHTGE